MIKLSKSIIGQEEIDAVTDVLRREYLGMGQDVRILEEKLKNYFGRDVVCVNTGTAALHLGLQAIGLKSGDEVLVQSLTYVASFQSISATGATPIACEVDEKTLTIDLVDAKQKLTSKTKAIMPVHYGGNVGDLDEIYKFAMANNLRVIEDASHAFGTVYNGKKIGSFGDICCISLDGIKNVTSGEGGILISSDEEVIKKVQDARLLGVLKDTEKRYNSERSWDFDVIEQGWRYHMSNIMAAIGIVQFGKFDYFKNKRQLLAKIYVSHLCDHKNIRLVDCDYDLVVPHIFVIRITNNDILSLREFLLDSEIQTGVHYKPSHLLNYYKDNQDNDTLLNTEKIYDQLLSLPLHPDLEEKDIIYICNKLLSKIV